jgi:hypothetical protein
MWKAVHGHNALGTAVHRFGVEHEVQSGNEHAEVDLGVQQAVHLPLHHRAHAHGSRARGRRSSSSSGKRNRIFSIVHVTIVVQIHTAFELQEHATCAVLQAHIMSGSFNGASAVSGSELFTSGAKTQV